MRVFVTGASGWVGSALVPELLAHGHQVLALARSESSAKVLKEAGVEVLRGDVEDLEVLKNGASASDAAIHLAFASDFSNMEKDCAIERAALEAMADAMAGTNKPLIMTTGTLAVADIDGSRGGKPATEDTEPLRNTPPFSERIKAEDLVLRLANEKKVKGMVMRLSPTVHGKGDERFITILGGIARKNGKAVYVGDGQTRWPSAHRIDTAAAFRLAIEKGRAGGIYHAVAEQGLSMKEIMEAIGRKVGVPVESVSPEEASQTLGTFAFLITIDDPASSDKTKKELGWKPKQIQLLDDIEQNYF